ncbi:galactokinase [soil metagenome]
MYRIVDGNTRGLADIGGFIDLINSSSSAVYDFFDSNLPILIARAPGRLDVMGGIADYSGSLVLEMPIAEATLAAVQKGNGDTIKIVSLSGNSEATLSFEFSLSELMKDAPAYDSVKEHFHGTQDHWASYVAGVFYVLRREIGASFETGARILIASHIPIGKGVSSSAALEVAAMQAVCAAFDIDIDPLQMSLLCQKVENSIVGAPCGVMDQITSNCGVENALIALLCQPAEILRTIKIPDEIEFWGVDSGVRHAVSGSDYTAVRVGAFMGYRMIAAAAGFAFTENADGTVKVNDTRWNGYLCNVSPDEYEKEFASLVPAQMSGNAFLQRFYGTTDHVTKVDRPQNYAVKAPAEHGIYENFRVNAFAGLLAEGATDKQLDRLGQLMFESHASYTSCGLTESGTDRIVELVRKNRQNGLYGARITGGGSGGTVAILARRGSRETILAIADQYRSETEREPYVFHGSSRGSSSFGCIQIAHESE